MTLPSDAPAIVDRVSAEPTHFSVPEYLSWDELQDLPDEIADDIELWEGRVVWNRRGPLVHQRFSVRMRNALESEARRAMAHATREGDEQCWEVEVEENVFFKSDKSSFLTPDFMVRRCMPRDARTTAADVVLVGEVLSKSDTQPRVDWKRERYADAGIPWYWEVELDSASWDISRIRAYELVVVQAEGLKVKPLRRAVYLPAGEWEPTDSAGIEFPEPFDMNISWDDLAF